MIPRPFEVAVLALFAIIVGTQLFVEPLLGIADNGDFPRLLQPAGLVERTTDHHDRYSNYFNVRYSIVPWPGRVPDYVSSSLLFVAAARLLNVALVDGAVFDVRVLGAVYLLGWLTGMYLILAASRGMRWPWRTALAALLLVMYTDPAYTAYFNSFYSEPTALVCLGLLMGCSLLLVTGRTASWVALAGYVLAGALLITAKPMFVASVLLLVPYGLYLSRLTTGWSRRWAGPGLACGLVLLAVWYHGMTPEWLRTNSHYIAVFRILLKDSSARERDARDLGLRPEWVRHAGSGPYARGSPATDEAFSAEFVARVNMLTIPAFFLRHPDRFYRVVSRVAGQASFTRVSFLGYYEKRTGKPPRSQPAAPWSEVRRRLMPRSGWSFGLYVLSGMAALVLGARRHAAEPRRGLLWSYGWLTAFAAMALLVPALVMAAFDPRFSITLVAAFDGTLILALGAVCWWASGILGRGQPAGRP